MTSATLAEPLSGFHELSLSPEVLSALDRAGYQGWAISEQPTNQAADVETARDLAQRMDRIFAS